MSAQPSLLLFGGTFDPVHNAHLEIARAAADLLGVGRVLFIPAANPPHKNHGPLASFADRVRMLEIACSADVRFEVSRIEEGTERSYSIDTITKLKHLGPLAFLIGADAFAEIQTWHRWRDVIAAVQFVVAARPGAKYETPAGACVTVIPDLHLDESSSGVRAMIAAGDDEAPVPGGVLAWIRARALYRSHETKISQTHSSHSV